MSEASTNPEATPEAEAAGADANAARRKPCPCGSGKKFKNCHEGREAELNALPADPNAGKAPAGPAKPASHPSGPPASSKQRFGPPPSRQSGTRGASTKAHRRV